MSKQVATKSYRSLNTFKQYITLDSTDYWHLQYPLNNKWEDYFWDMSQKAFACQLSRDENNITQYTGEDGKTYHSMIEIAQYGMASYQAYCKTKEIKWLKESENHAIYLINNINPYKSATSALINKYPVSLYDLREDWVSSLAYGVAISLFIRLYILTGRENYMIGAKRLGENYEIEVADGGIMRSVPGFDNFIIYEEYPAKSLSGVLNGHITALWALYDLGKYEDMYRNLFHLRAGELARNLGAWDADYWSYYDLKNVISGEENLASVHYHMLHIKQLLIMYQLTGFADFAEFAEECIRNKFSILSKIKAFSGKAYFRIKKDFLRS